jgi:hypothetical protein
MVYLMHYKLVVLSCAIMGVFLLVPPLAEIIFFDCPLYCIEIIDYTSVVLMSFVLSIISILIVSLSFKSGFYKKDIFYLYNDGTEQKWIFLFIIIAFAIFLSFYFKVGGSYSIKGFAEAYRNGGFKGSGIYTFLGVQVSPLLLSFILVKSKKITLFFHLSMFFVLIMTFLLGLRVYLLIIFLFLICRMMLNFPIVKVAMYLFVILVFMSSYKIFLNDGLSLSDSYNTGVHMLGRLSIRYVLNPPQNYSYEGMQCLIPIVNSFQSFCDLESVKGMIVNQNMNIMLEMPFIDKVTGVAMPLPVFVYNLLGLSGVAASVFFSIIFIAVIFWRISRSKNILESLVLIYLAFLFFAGLVEDINFYRKLIHLPLLVGVSWIILKMRSLRCF